MIILQPQWCACIFDVPIPILRNGITVLRHVAWFSPNVHSSSWLRHISPLKLVALTLMLVRALVFVIIGGDDTVVPHPMVFNVEIGTPTAGSIPHYSSSYNDLLLVGPSFFVDSTTIDHHFPQLSPLFWCKLISIMAHNIFHLSASFW